MLSVTYGFEDDLPEEAPVRVMEGRGWVHYELSRRGGLFLPEGVAALNAASQAIIDGGQWFQLWKGDIVSLRSPETGGMSRGRLHRGPLAHQAS